MSCIEFDAVTKAFGAVTAVDDLSFRLETGSITGLIGANGAGKSTALRVLLGLSRPTSGAATFGGRRYDELSDPTRSVGAMTDPDVFHRGRTGRDALRVLGAASGVKNSRIEEMLELVGLTAAGSQRVGGYSLGMRQRLGLAAALLGDPQTLVLDEPANGLDPLGVHWLRTFLRQLADQGRTVLVSSHQLAELGQTVQDVVVMHQGRLLTHGPIAELVADSGSASLENLFFDLVQKGSAA